MGRYTAEQFREWRRKRAEAIRPWERQGREPPAIFELFARYRDMGPLRSIRKYAGMCIDKRYQGVETKRTYLEMTASRWRWKARALAWDDEQDRLIREALTREKIRSKRRAMILSQALAKKSLEATKILQANTIKGSSIAVMAKVSADLARLALDESTVIVEQRASPEVMELATQIKRMDDGAVEEALGRLTAPPRSARRDSSRGAEAPAGDRPN